MRVKRRHTRSIVTSWNLRYKANDAASADGYVAASLVNVGRGGICFDSPQELGLGAQLDIELSSDSFPAPILATGRVVWCRRSKVSSEFEVGVEFSDTSWDAQRQGAE